LSTKWERVEPQRDSTRSFILTDLFIFSHKSKQKVSNQKSKLNWNVFSLSAGSGIRGAQPQSTEKNIA
jgi:hypothetical protein